MFLITAAIYLTGAFAFIILGTANTQKWALQDNKPSLEEEYDEELKEPLAAKA